MRLVRYHIDLTTRERDPTSERHPVENAILFINQKLYVKDEKRLKKQNRRKEIEELTRDDPWFACDGPFPYDLLSQHTLVAGMSSYVESFAVKTSRDISAHSKRNKCSFITSKTRTSLLSRVILTSGLILISGSSCVDECALVSVSNYHSLAIERIVRDERWKVPCKYFAKPISQGQRWKNRAHFGLFHGCCRSVWPDCLRVVWGRGAVG